MLLNLILSGFAFFFACCQLVYGNKPPLAVGSIFSVGGLMVSLFYGSAAYQYTATVLMMFTGLFILFVGGGLTFRWLMDAMNKEPDYSFTWRELFMSVWLALAVLGALCLLYEKGVILWLMIRF